MTRNVSTEEGCPLEHYGCRKIWQYGEKDELLLVHSSEPGFLLAVTQALRANDNTFRKPRVLLSVVRSEEGQFSG